MYNKKVLNKATANLDKAKAPVKKADIITDPMGQWKYPGQNTRIPGGNITMEGVPYPVMAQPNVGQPQMMYPGQDYQFPGADYVDEYPMAKKGGALPKLPKKKNSKGYSRSLTAINKLFAQNLLTKKNKSRKNKVFDPNAKYYQEGGALPEDYSQFTNFVQTLPSNLQDPEYQYGNPDQYNLYGMWETVGKPQSFKDVQDSDYFPLQDDGEYHGFTVGSDGEFLKPMSHSTTWKEVMNSELNTDPYFKENRLIKNEQGRLQYVPNKQKGGFHTDINKRRQLLRDWVYGADIGMLQEANGGYLEADLTDEEIEQYRKGGYVVEELPQAQTGRNVRYTDDPNDPGIKAYNDSLYSWNRGSQLLLSDPNISTAKEKVADGIFHPLDPLGPGSPSIEQYRKVLLPDSNSLTFKKPVQPVSFQSEPEIGKLLTKKLPQVQTPEIIPSNYNYTPKKPETIRTASRSQTVMEPDPNNPGKFKVKELREVPYSAYFPGEGWEDMNAPRVMYYNPTTEEETEERFQRGGLIQAQNGLTIADPKEYAYRKGMYDDSLSLYNAYQFQKANYKPGYDAWLTDVGKDITGGKEALKKAREKNLGKPLQKSYYTKTHKKSGYNNPSGDKNFDPLYPQEKFIIDKYKSIVKGNPNFRIGMHNSPDLWHKKIMPSGSYYAGAMNPIYKKPVQAIYKPGEEPTSDLESTNKESISLKTKPLQKINIESNLQNEVIPSTYSKPKKYNPTKTAYRSQTIMEQDPNRPGEYRMKESRQVPYATTKMYRKGDVWEDEYAPRVLWIDDEGNEVDVDPRKNNVAESSSFRKGGYIDAELTPEEIDWYRSQGYQIEDMD